MKLTSSGTYKFMRHEGKEIGEHRYIMHMVDPRPNEDELVVHHIDGNKSNNDPSNLVWMTSSEHSRLHKLGENHFPCSGKDNANYRHGMCVGGESPEYKRYHNHKTYMRHRERRLAKQNAYGAEHRDQKRLYDKLRYWNKQMELASTEERKAECLSKIKILKEMKI